MFTPNLFKFKNNAEIIQFMKRYSFATIVTIKDNIPIATQLPFFIEDGHNKIVLKSHFAASNEQVKYIENNISLIIFSEPHAYISPKNYDKFESVPTWDYIAVHAYGKAIILNDNNDKEQILEQMIGFYEPEYLEQWGQLSDKYKNGMLKGIVAFELEITELQGQKKLSQNKSLNERQKIINNLESSQNSVEYDLAQYIKDL